MKTTLYPKYFIRSLFAKGKDGFFSAGYKLLYPECCSEGMTPWQHYLIDGKRKGFDNGSHPSDIRFFPEGYKLEYPDVKKAGVDPWRHYAEKGYAEGRDNGLHPGAGEFFAEGYLEMYPDVKKAGADPWHHYVLHGKKEGRDNGLHPTEDVFFPTGYLAIYTDLAKAKIDLWHHYVLHGKKEGRSSCAIKDKFVYEGIRLKNTNKNILVVTYRASRTSGVSVLTLNIIKSLNHDNNVFTVCLDGGNLLEDIVSNSCQTMVVGSKYIYKSEVIKNFFIKYFNKYKFSYAIVNSICASYFLRLTFDFDIPSVILVHEFSYGTFDNMYRNIMLADNVIFSNQLIQSSFLSKYGSLPASITVIPQGDPKIISDLPSLDKDEEKWENFIKNTARKHKIIVGMGNRSYRKGVDLFLLTASEILKKTDHEKVFFLWIGAPVVNEQIPKWDIDFKIDILNLRNNFAFIPNLKCLNEVFNFFALTILTSRLDPLPNVVIGSMRNGIPVVSFDEVSGICAILKSNGLGELCLAKYLDCYGLAEKASDLLNKQELYGQVSKKLFSIYNEEFLFDNYIQKLLNEVSRAESNHAKLLKIVHDISDKQFLYLDTSSLAATKLGLQYVLNCQNKPYPGFLTIVDSENRTVKDCDFIEKRKNNYESMDGQSMPFGKISSRIAIHIHAYYLDELTDIVTRIMLNNCSRNVFFLVSTTSDNFDSVKELFAKNHLKCLVRISDNIGRDYGPFLTLFNDCISSFEIIGHVHTKKSVGLDGQFVRRWKDSMLSALLGSSEKSGAINMLDRNLTYMEKHRDVGLLFPDHRHVCGWNLNKLAVSNLIKRIGVDIPNLTSLNQFNFPVGSMFFARYDAIKSLFVLTNDDFPSEPLAYDGTILHAIERILPFLSNLNNYRNVCVYNKFHLEFKF